MSEPGHTPPEKLGPRIASVSGRRIDIVVNGYEYGLAPPERQGKRQGRSR